MYKIMQENQGYGLCGNDVLVPNLFQSYSETGMFVYLLNEFDASPVHLYDIIEDYFGSF